MNLFMQLHWRYWKTLSSELQPVETLDEQCLLTNHRTKQMRDRKAKQNNLINYLKFISNSFSSGNTIITKGKILHYKHLQKYISTLGPTPIPTCPPPSLKEAEMTAAPLLQLRCWTQISRIHRLVWDYGWCVAHTHTVSWTTCLSRCISWPCIYSEWRLDGWRGGGEGGGEGGSGSSLDQYNQSAADPPSLTSLAPLTQRNSKTVWRWSGLERRRQLQAPAAPRYYCYYYDDEMLLFLASVHSL